MKIFTAHIREAGDPPVLVREGFSWGALIFGGFWLLAQRAWIPGILALCGAVALRFLPYAGVLEFGLAWALGVFGRDLVRWSLALRGFTEAHVIAAGDSDTALARLLARRPDLSLEALK